MSFDDDLEFGKEGETKVRQILESSGIFEQILDCSNDKYFQEKDIDFLALASDGHIAKCEVKNDRTAHKTGNIVFEQRTNGNLGCLAKTEADYIFYVLAGNSRIYCFNAEQMRQYIKRKRFRPVRMGDNATGYLLKIKELIRDKQIRRIK